MTFAQLTSAFAAYNFSFLTSALSQDLVKQAVRDVTLAERWLPRLADTTVTIGASAQLGPIEQVTYQGAPLYDVGTILDARNLHPGDQLTALGTPREFYRTGLTIKVWPVASGQVVVSQLRTTPWTVGGSAPQDTLDTPIIGSDFDDAIILRSRVLAHEEADEYDAAEKLQNRLEQRIAALVTNVQVVPRRQYIRQTRTYA